MSDRQFTLPSLHTSPARTKNQNASQHAATPITPLVHYMNHKDYSHFSQPITNSLTMSYFEPEQCEEKEENVEDWMKQFEAAKKNSSHPSETQVEDEPASKKQKLNHDDGTTIHTEEQVTEVEPAKEQINSTLDLLIKQKKRRTSFIERANCQHAEESFILKTETEGQDVYTVDFCKYPFGLRSYFNGFRMLLVRHAESEANVNKCILQQLPDYTIPLSQRGREQARQCGKFIKQFYSQLNTQLQKDWEEWKRTTPSEDLEFTIELQQHAHFHQKCITINRDKCPKMKVRLWTSPYKRARETAQIIQEEAGEFIHDCKESILLGEQQFGLFEGEPVEELNQKFPVEVQYFEKQIAFGGRFYARMPLGESRFDVCLRLQQFFGSLERARSRELICDNIIVAHGVSVRAFTMQFMHYSVEWMECSDNAQNASVRFLSTAGESNEHYKDYSYIFQGFNH